MTQRMAYDPERVITKLAEQLAIAHTRIAKLEAVIEDQADEAAGHAESEGQR